MKTNLLLALVALVSGALSSSAQISKGHQILVEHGLQVQGMVANYDPFHLETYSNANYTAVYWIWDSTPPWMGEPPGFPWARWVRNESEMPPRAGEQPYLPQLLMLQLADELELNNETVRNRMVDWFNSVRAQWPNTILYHNSYGGQVGDAQLFDFYSRARPDMLSFDTYPFRLDSEGNKFETLIHWYGDLRRYREHAKGANLPLATYLQTFGSRTENVSHPSPSELRLQHSVALAFSCKVLVDFTYNTGASSLFTNVFGGDNAPNALYYEKADAALRARNLGKALVRLKPIDDAPFPDLRTTGMMFIRGRHSDGTFKPFPIGFFAGPNDPHTDWLRGRNDPFLTSNWSVRNLGPKNNGHPGDVILSWFKPLDESFDGPSHTNEIYLMVVNALSDLTGSAEECAQEIILNFDQRLLAIERLDPASGIVIPEALPLTNGQRRLTLQLNGGDAALFKFANGAPFIGADVSGAPVIAQAPADRVALIDGQTTLRALATGAAPISYQWRFEGEPIDGKTSSELSLSPLRFSDSGRYDVVASNSFGSVTSSVAVLSVVSQLPPPSPFLYEPFDYANLGGPVSSNEPSRWTFGGSGPNDFHIAGGNLFYPGLAAPTGHSATNGGVGLGVRRLLGTNVNAGVIYFSALLRINDLGFGVWNGAATQVGALTSTDNSSFRLAVMVRSNSPGGFVIGVQKGGQGVSPTFDTQEWRTNETLLLVGKYDFTVSFNPATLWINPDPATLGSSTEPIGGLVATTGTSGLTIDRFNFRQNTAASVPAAIQWDELRVGTNWATVTPPAFPLRVTSIRLFDDGRVEVKAIGNPGSATAEASTNLIDWIAITNLSDASGMFQFNEPAADRDRRFFRFRVPQ